MKIENYMKSMGRGARAAARVFTGTATGAKNAALPDRPEPADAPPMEAMAGGAPPAAETPQWAVQSMEHPDESLFEFTKQASWTR